MPPIYLIAQVRVTDEAAFKEYRDRVKPMVDRYGGKYLARGGAIQTLEGKWNPPRVTIIEFPSRQAFDRFYTSSEYAPLLALRKKATESTVTIVEGYSPA